MLHIPGILAPDSLERVRALLDEGDWIDGAATAGHLSRRVKHNRQLPEGSPAAATAGRIILEALQANADFISAALPRRIVPPLFNRHGAGESYGPHIDGAIRPVGSGRVRTDLAATLFLADPDAYEGGALRIRDSSGDRNIKLPAGDLILYPASSVHEVEPVSHGERLAAFLWIQSIVRNLEQREMLYELDRAIQDLDAALPDHPALISLTGHYHNLLRQWADV